MAADKSFEWISMSLGKARWIPFNVDKEIARAFSTPCPRPSETHVYGEIIEAVSKWADEARESIIHWVVGELLGGGAAVAGAARADQFRSLGRGWVFIFIQRQQKRFRWWFESIARVRADHQHDLDDLTEATKADGERTRCAHTSCRASADAWPRWRQRSRWRSRPARLLLARTTM